MKKLITILSALCLVLMVFAQSPEKMSYQAVVRNIKGELIVNRTIGVKISILQETASGTVVYAETHLPQSNENGLVSIEVGAGTPVTGKFPDIEWAKGPYFIKTEMDPAGGKAYTITATSQLLSVPYALYAKNTGSIPDNSVNSAKITDGSVGTADLAPNSVTSPKIADGTIATADIADGAVTVAKLPGGATASTYLRGDGSWTVPSGDGSGLWTENTGNIYYNGGNVGIGLDKPIYMLHVEAPIAGGTAIWGRSNSDTPGTRGVFGGEYGTVNGTANTLSGAFAGVMGYTNWARSYHYGVMGVRADRDYGNSAGVIGMVDGTNGDKPWGALGYQDAALQEWAGYFKGIVKADQLHVSGNTWTAGLITGPSNLTQDADLDVTGTVKLGSYGIVFKEIKELTGTTDATKNYVSIYFNTGITAKMRILSAEINASGTNWNTLGMTDSRDPGRSVGCSVTNNYIHLHYPGTDAYFNRNYRILVMILP